MSEKKGWLVLNCMATTMLVSSVHLLYEQFMVGIASLPAAGEARCVSEQEAQWTGKWCASRNLFISHVLLWLCVQCFFMSAPTLLKVSLCECDAMTDDGITLLVKNTPNLRSLNISKCCQLSGKCLHAIAKVGKCLHAIANPYTVTTTLWGSLGD